MNQPIIPEGSIIITPTEVYNEVKSLTEAVRQMVAQDVAEVESRRDLKARVDQHDTRISAIERKMLLFTGAAAALGAGVGTWLPRVLGS